MEDADIHNLLCLQEDLSPHEGCDGSSLENWKSWPGAKLRAAIEERLRHVCLSIVTQRAALDSGSRATELRETALDSDSRATELRETHERINGLWKITQLPNRDIKREWKTYLGPRTTRRRTWWCCPKCATALIAQREPAPAALPAGVSHETHDDTNSGAIPRSGPEPIPIPIPRDEHTPSRQPDGTHSTQDGEDVDSGPGSQDASTQHRDSTPALPGDSGTSIVNGSPLDSEPGQAPTRYHEDRNPIFTPPASNRKHHDSQDDEQDEGENNEHGGHKESEQGVDDNDGGMRRGRDMERSPERSPEPSTLPPKITTRCVTCAPKGNYHCLCGDGQPYRTVRQLFKHVQSNCLKAPMTAPPKRSGIQPNRCVLCGMVRTHNMPRHEKTTHYLYSCGSVGVAKRHDCLGPATCTVLRTIDPCHYAILGLLDDLDGSLDKIMRLLPARHINDLDSRSDQDLVVVIRRALSRATTADSFDSRVTGKTADVSQSEDFVESETSEFHNGEPACQPDSRARGGTTESDGCDAIPTSNEQESTTSRSMPSRQAPAGKRKRNESESSTECGVTSEKEDRDAVESEGATILPVSSQIRDPRAPRNDSVPDIPRVSSPSIQVELSQHAANAQHGEFPPEDLDRVSSHPESLDHGTAETYSTPTMPNQAQPNFHCPRDVTESIADAQSEHPPISTKNELLCQTSPGDIAPGSVLIQGDSHSVRDTSAPLTHHTPNHPDYASPSGISQVDISGAELPAIGVAATDERASTLYTSLSQSTDLIVGGADVAAPPPLTGAIHSPPIVDATSGQPLPPRSGEKGIPTSLPMPINSDSASHNAATASHLPDGDRRPNKRQRILTGGIELSLDSRHGPDTPQFAHDSTPRHSSTGFADIPGTRAVGLEHSLHSQTAVAQVSYFNESTASHPPPGSLACGPVSYESSAPSTTIASGYSLPALTAPDHSYKQGSSVEDVITNECSIATTNHPPPVTLISSPDPYRHVWQKVTLNLESSGDRFSSGGPSQRSPELGARAHWEPASTGTSDHREAEQRPFYDCSLPAAVGAVLGSRLFDRIERSHLRKWEREIKQLFTNAVRTCGYTNRWVICITLRLPESPDAELTDVSLLKDVIATATCADSQARQGIVIERCHPLHPLGEREDYQLQCTIDKEKGAAMVESLYDLTPIQGLLKPLDPNVR
jgi:hypothetical protein